ncbi:MAG TPA: hypothetical protein VKD47_06365 [Miltoncostaeaceae bacterium]|nr:hypothetical protein [Miltoncostaeaceae bacterium]
MAIHLTPDELSDALGMDSREIVRLCREESVPILGGRIDKTLFVYSMKAAGHGIPEDAEVLLQMR